MTHSTKIASAPGKIILLGEYSVLEGYEAVSMAVDKTFKCQLTKGNGSAVKAGDSLFPITLKNGVLKLEGAPPVFKLAETVFQHAVQHDFSVPCGTYEFDSSELCGPDGRKLGLGSSAALCSALMKQLLPAANCDTIFKHALAAHKLFSGGKGSGLDVATTCYGGIIEFQAGAELPEINNIEPNELFQNLIVVDCGCSQNTRAQLEQLQIYKNLKPTEYDQKIAQLAKSFASLKKQLFQPESSWAELVTCVDESVNMLRKLAKAANMQIISPRIEEIISLAKAQGGTAKSTGAGGGDLVLAFIPKTNHQNFTHSLEGSDFTPIPVEVAHTGVSAN